MKMEEENLLKERETFGSRLGFILVSAGCAVGLGNVWKFPYMTGKYGGAAFILIYLGFLVLLGLPILVSEFAVGRSSRLSTARAFHKLEPEGSNFHKYSYMGMIGNYMLMMFYTMVAGWMMYYCYVMATGKLSGASSEEVSRFFSNLMTSTGTMTGWMIAAVLLAFGVCSLGLQNGIERITKIMMICLLALIVVLAVHSVTLDGAMEGVKFYLVPNLDNIREAGIGNVIFGALSQALDVYKRQVQTPLHSAFTRQVHRSIWNLQETVSWLTSLQQGQLSRLLSADRASVPETHLQIMRSVSVIQRETSRTVKVPRSRTDRFLPLHLWMRDPSQQQQQTKAS